MMENPSEAVGRKSLRAYADGVYDALAPRAYSVIMIGALLCNVAVKLFHAVRSGLVREFPAWILTDIAVLLAIDAALILICNRRPTKAVIRCATVFAAVICTWSVMNAGWLIRTGTQILPMVLKSLFRDPVNISWLVLKNLARMPGVAAILLVPSAVALAFFFSVLARPVVLEYDSRRFRNQMITLLTISALAAVGHTAVSALWPGKIVAGGLRFNCQSRAVLAFVLPEYRHLARKDFRNATRELPRAGEIEIRLKPRSINHNIVIVVLEGIQYDCTSLAAEQAGIAPQTGDRPGGLTPCLARLAAEGASFTNARAVVTHTTKGLFGLLTGRAPSASQDISETVPVDQPYASLATILKKGLGFRTAFFQSAKGTFEARPGLVHNLGFDKFWSREDLRDPKQFVGYLGSDEFAMLSPITAWIQSQDKPFLLVALCSVTHDPYDVPEWFGDKPEEQVDRYKQAVSYTDSFIAALDVQLTSLGLADDTVLCVVGDHGEAFGEHRIMGHERAGFEEVLRIAMCLRAPLLIEPGTRITAPVTSMDLTPTILGLLGFDLDPMSFDGINAMELPPQDRKLYFSCWMQEGPAGFIRGDRKYVYDPERNAVTLYRLNADPLELSGLELSQDEARGIVEQIVAWRRGTIFRLDEDARGQRMLFDSWSCKWNGRVCGVRYEHGQ